MQTTMLIKMDKKLKTEVQKVAAALGLPLSTVIQGYLRQFVAERAITFSAPMPNAATIRAIKEARRDFKAGKTAGPFKTAQEAIAFLEKNDKEK